MIRHAETTTKMETLAPHWYEVVDIACELPTDLTLAPGLCYKRKNINKNFIEKEILNMLQILTYTCGTTIQFNNTPN